MVWPSILGHRSDDERQDAPLQSQGEGEGWYKRPGYKSKRPDGIHCAKLSKRFAKGKTGLFL